VSWKDSTRATTDQIIETHVLRDLGSRALSLITCKELQAHHDAKAATQLSQSVVGVRPSEIVGLQVGDFHDGMIHIARRIYRGIVGVPKSLRSHRPIHPTETPRALLAQWLELLQDDTQAAWLFPSQNGTTPLSYSDVCRWRIQPVLAKVGLGNLNFQALRRSRATEFSEVEQDPNVQSQLPGHGVERARERVSTGATSGAEARHP
jgi:integrase